MDEKLREIIADTLGVEADEVEPALSRETAEAWDSLNHLRLITAVEEAFGIKLSMAEIQQINSVADLNGCVNSYVANA